MNLHQNNAHEEKNRIVALSLFHVVAPGSVEMFLDNSDSLWRAFDRYASRHGLQAVQMFTIGQGLDLKKPLAARKANTLFWLVPKRPLQILRWLWRELRNVVILHLNNESWSDFFAALIGKMRGAKVLVFLHNNQNPLRGKLPKPLLRFFRRHVVDAFMTNALETKTQFNRHVDGPVYLFTFGYDHALFRAGRRKRSALLNVLFVGRISPEKKIEDIIHAISIARARQKILFHLAGDDPTPGRAYLDSLLKLMREKGVAYRYWGFVPHSRLAPVYYAADLFVNMRPDEPFGKVFVEAMATGLPVIGRTGAPGAELLIHHNINGVKVKSANELARFFDRVLRTKSLLKTMGRHARRLVAERFNEDASAAMLERAYNDLRAGHAAEQQFYGSRRYSFLRRIMPKA